MRQPPFSFFLKLILIKKKILWSFNIIKKNQKIQERNEQRIKNAKKMIKKNKRHFLKSDACTNFTKYQIFKPKIYRIK